MFPLFHLLFLLLFAWAWLRVRAPGAGLTSDWWLLGSTLLLVPVAIATLSLAVLTQTEAVGPTAILSAYAIGLLLMAAGFLIGGRWSTGSAAMLVGWGTVAGLTLIPSTLSLALPLVALLSFPVLRWFSRTRPVGA